MQNICLCYWKQTLLSALCFVAAISGLTTKSVGSECISYASWLLKTGTPGWLLMGRSEVSRSLSLAAGKGHAPLLQGHH